MINKACITGLSSLLFFSGLTIGYSDSMKMPMKFNSESMYTEVLTSYPLGKINKIAAFSHHGKANKEIMLPNGREGWVYEAEGYYTPKTYIMANGEKKVMNQRIDSNEYRNYILVFGIDEKIIDVLYQDKNITGSALQFQHIKMKNH